MFTWILDLIFPPSAAVRAARCQSVYALGYAPLTGTSSASVEIVSLFSYDTSVRDIVREAKFFNNPDTQRFLARALDEYAKEIPADCVIVPLPLCADRYKERGFNQIERILKRSEELAPRVRADVLTRQRGFGTQTRRDRKERLSAMKGAFECTQDLEGVHVIVVDDVTTTGATLKDAHRALSCCGAEVTLLALARTPAL